MNELMLARDYPADKYNLLGSTSVMMVAIPSIKTPVIQAIVLKPKTEYELFKEGYTDRKGVVHPDEYIILNKGLERIAQNAGISEVKKKVMIPTSCQKCVSINQGLGKIVPCGSCGNKDVAYEVTIAVPQLTGQILYYTGTREINVENELAKFNSKDTQKNEKNKREFLSHVSEVCATKAKLRAVRAALQIKHTYTLEELKKPFVVAYLIPNLDDADVKQAAIANMFNSTEALFGRGKAPQQALPQPEMVPAIEQQQESYQDDGYVDDYLDEEYAEQPEPQPLPQTSYAANTQQYPQNQPVYAANTQQTRQTQQATRIDPSLPPCTECGAAIDEKVLDYSIKKYGRPLCYSCQRKGVK
jgi:hypothetical protein